MSGISQTKAEEFLAFAHRLADAAAEITRAKFRSSVAAENKGGYRFDPVTEADREAEAIIRRLIEMAYPDHGIIGEEHGAAASKVGLTWVIDPIDGTRSFISGNPLWGTLIALSDEDGPILGLMDMPWLQERLWGLRLKSGRKAGLSARGERQAIKARPCPGLDQAILSTTTTDVFETVAEQAAFEALRGRVRMTRFGGDCYQYGLLAMGFMDVVVEASLQPYDVHALIPIVEGAGGRITTWDGAPAQRGGCVVAAGDPELHEAVLGVLQSAAN